MAQFTLSQIFGVNYDPKQRFKKLKKPKLNKEMLGRLMDHTDAHNRVVAKQRRAVISRTLDKLDKVERRNITPGAEKRAKLQIKDAHLRCVAASRKARLRIDHFPLDSGESVEPSFQLSSDDMKSMRDEMRAIRAMSPAELTVMKDKLLRALEPRAGNKKHLREKDKSSKKSKSPKDKEMHKQQKKARTEKKSKKVNLNKLKHELAKLKELNRISSSSEPKRKRKCEIVVLSSDSEDELEMMESFNRQEKITEVIEVDNSSSECEDDIQSVSEPENLVDLESESESEASDRWRMAS